MMMTNVLIMEDDLNLIRLFGKALEHAGYEVSKATSIDEARRLLDENEFDMFIADMRLGGDQGIDLLRERRAELFNGRTQIVVMSAEEQYRGACEELGIDLFISKPVAPSLMIQLLNRLQARA
jgi:DNA-binding response OmpR family regulator